VECGDQVKQTSFGQKWVVDVLAKEIAFAVGSPGSVVITKNAAGQQLRLLSSCSWHLASPNYELAFKQHN